MIFRSVFRNFFYLFVFGLTTRDTLSLLRRLGAIAAYIYKHKLIIAFCLNHVVIRAGHTFLSSFADQHLCVYFHLY